MLDALVTSREWPVAFAHAVRGGARADRVAFAFAAGYQAALRALVPGLPEGGVVSLAATETGGAHPRAIATALRPDDDGGGFRLGGVKTFATQADQAQVFLVLATEGTSAGGRAQLRVARVARDAPGVAIEGLPPTPFCPEIGHGVLRLTNVPLADTDVLDGDGWTEVVKPFRTVEDIHVHGAVLAYVLGAASRFGAPREACEQLAAAIVTFGALAARDPSAAATHLVLAGAIATSRRTLETHASFWDAAPEDVRTRWLRDQPLLQIAEKARTARTSAAWAAGAAGAAGGQDPGS
jgi:acyl-CoA dehydrogenase